MKTIKCVAIDDEPLALEKLTEFIRRINYLELLESFYNPLDALSFLKKMPVDLLFLDIQMDGITGIELIETLNPKAGVILITAHSEYALKGYELRVHDYLLKPYSFQRFLKAVDTFADARDRYDGKQPEFNGTLFVKSGNVWRNIRIDQILYVEGMKDYLSIWTTGERIMTLMNFTKLMEMIPMSHFFRIHRSYLVSLDKIKEVTKNRVRIGDTYLPVGDTYKEDFFRRLG
jgi:two-component system, LytTR family, response regulator